MEEELSLDNILDDSSIGLFNEVETPADEPSSDNNDTEENKKEETDTTTEVDVDSLFGDKSPESVGSEEDNQEEKEDAPSDKSEGASPDNFFSSIARACAEEGILPNLDDDSISDIKTPEDFRKAIDDYIKSELDEQQQRVKEALDNNVEPDIVRQYENILKQLDSISNEDIEEESDQGELLRKRLLYQDYINRGFDKARAEREVNKAVQNGSDVDDAIEALKSHKEFYKKGYDKILNEAKQKQEEERKANEERAEKIKKNIMNEKNYIFDGLELTKNVRQQIYDNISKPVYRDPQTGDTYTAIQKFELENRDEFITKLGLIFTLTNGFKDLNGLIKGKVKKEVSRGFRDLENKINNTSRDSYGNLKFTSGVSDESYLGKGVRLNI